MGVIGATNGVIDGLKNNPTLLAMVVINVIWLGAGGWFVSQIAERSANRDALVIQLLQKKECL